VLSEELAKSLFGAEDAVGKLVTFGDEQYRVTGVIAEWRPQPKFYDLTNGSLNPSESAYIPFTVAIDKQLGSSGNNNCFAEPPAPGWDGYLASDCIWLQFWAELPDESARGAYLDFLNAYADEQNKLGRFARTRNNHIHRVDEWMVNQEVVPEDNKIFVGVGFAFLLVCLINAVGLMLAKFLRRTGELAVRRALGASRKALFAQHLTEAGLVGVIGGVLGLLFTWLGLLGVRALSPGLSQIAVLDAGMLALLLTLAISGAVLAGVYPAWRACRVMPAANLKSN
jgi:putative ABC transport system permease protein